MNWTDQQDSERQAQEERAWDALAARLGPQQAAYTTPAPVNWDELAPCRGCGEPVADGALYCRCCQDARGPIVDFQPGAAEDGQALVALTPWLVLVALGVVFVLAAFGAGWGTALWLAPFGGR